VDVSGIYANVADYGDGLRVINVSDPYAPFEEAYYDTGGRSRGVALAGGMAYVADGRNGLYILGSDTVPVALAYFRALRVDAGARLDWEFSGTMEGEGFHLYRREQGLSWRRLTDAPLSGRSEYSFLDAAAPHGALEYALVELAAGGEERWLRTASLAASEAGTPALRLAQNHPNPFNPATDLEFVLPAAARARLAIFDASGRRVAVLIDEALPAGPRSVSWDGRDHRGRELPSGVYVARLAAGRERVERKLVLAR